MTEIVLGPPGTGKTSTLLGIVEEELSRGTPPDRIGYVSFTRRAAEEAMTRAGSKFGLSRTDLPYFRTLHSLCYWRLGLTRDSVLEGRRLDEFADYARITITGKFSEDGTLSGYSPGDRIMHMINIARVRCIALRDAYDQIDDDDLSWPEVQRVSGALDQFKSTHGLLDYTDMLEEYVRAGTRSALEVLLVDEAQDLFTLQWRIVELLGAGCRRGVVAGDDDQAIYRWAGADVEHLINMAGDVRVLGQSYRVPRTIQEVAARVVGAVARRRPKEWAARDEAGSVDHARNFHNVNIGTDESVLVLARNTYLLRDNVESVLRREGVVYERGGHPSIRAGLLETITAWERLRAGEQVSIVDARRCYEHMSSGIGVTRGYKSLPGRPDDAMVTIADLKRDGGLLRDDVWFTAFDRLPVKDTGYIRAARKRGESLRGTPRVRLSTIHGAKGGEADHVILLTDMAPRTHAEMERVSRDDEARVWYVAVTRARQRLTIVDPRTRLYCPWL